MRGRRKDTLFDVLLGTGLDLLNLVRDRAADHAESVTEAAKDAYETASGRVRKASRAMTGEHHSGLGSVAALLAGVGVGVALGILLRPHRGNRCGATLPTPLGNSEGEFAAGCPASRMRADRRNVYRASAI